MKQYIDGHFDFELTHKGCYSFFYKDLSTWVDNEKPESYILEIQFPGFSNYKEVSVKTDVINILKYNNENMKLIDGIYCLKYNNNGVEYIKQVGVACTLKCKLNNMISKATLENKEEYEKILKIKFYLESFYINSEVKKNEIATKFYNLAEEELSCIKCKC